MLQPATRKDAPVLTDISFSSKRYWRYPEEYFDIWGSELTITENYIENNEVYLYLENGLVVAYYSLVELTDETEVSKGIVLAAGWWLEHMFVLPDCIGKTIGTQLFSHMVDVCREKQISTISLLSDPYAAGFYEKMGCEYVKEIDSTIAGRTTPLYHKKII